MKSFLCLFGFFITAILSGCSSLESGVYLTVISNDSVVNVDRSDWPVKGLDPSVGEWRPPVKKYTFSNEVELLVYPIILERRNFDGPLIVPLIPYPKSLNGPETRGVLRVEYSEGMSDVNIGSIKSIPVETSCVKRTKDGGEIVVLLKLTDEYIKEDILEISFVCGDERKTLVFKRRRFTNYIPFFVPL
jgi:hypothetical protein